MPASPSSPILAFRADKHGITARSISRNFLWYKKDLIHPKMNKVFSFFIPFSLLFYLMGKDKEIYLWEDRGEVEGTKGVPRIFPSSSPGALFSISLPFHFPIFPFPIQKKRREERGRRRRKFFSISLPNFFQK